MALVRNIQHVSGEVSTLGDNTLVAAPGAGQRIAVVMYLVQNKSATSLTMKLKFGTTQVREVLADVKGDGMVENFRPFYWLLGGDNEALILNLSAAEAVTYSIDYFVTAV